MVAKRYKVQREDVELAQLYHSEYLDRGDLGLFLEKQGMGVNHHTFSNCPDRYFYINLVLDQALGPEIRLVDFGKSA